MVHELKAVHRHGGKHIVPVHFRHGKKPPGISKCTARILDSIETLAPVNKKTPPTAVSEAELLDHIKTQYGKDYTKTPADVKRWNEAIEEAKVHAFVFQHEEPSPGFTVTATGKKKIQEIRESDPDMLAFSTSSNVEAQAVA